MADETDNSDVELVDYNPELFVADGELWVRDRDAFCDQYGILALCTYEGIPCAVIHGKGVVSLHNLLTERSGPRAVR